MKQATSLWIKKMAGLLTEDEERAMAVAGGDENEVPPMGGDAGVGGEEDFGGEEDLDQHMEEEGNAFDAACTALDDVVATIEEEMGQMDESDPRYEQYQQILSLKDQICAAMAEHTESYSNDDEFGGEEDLGGEGDIGGEEDLGGEEPPMGGRPDMSGGM